MGRDVTGIKSDQNLNVKSNVVPFDCVHAAPMTSNEEVAPKQELIADHSLKEAVSEESQEKQEVSTVESSTNIEAGAPDDKPTVKPSPDTDASESITSSLEAQSQEVSTDKIDSGISNASEVEISRTSNSPLPKENDHPRLTDKNDLSISNASEVEIDSTSNSPLPKKHGMTDEIDSGISNASEAEVDSTCNNPLPKKNDLPPVHDKTKQQRSPSVSGKSIKSDTDNEEDNCSLASSAGSSVRSSKFKITVPVAPKFVSDERVARRKELNRQREEKQKALEAERRNFEVRVKEEEEGEIRQLRKSMSYKANPVPKFYREGPPPKAKLKKLPLTRPKSPKFSRRKSCSDAFKPGPDGKRNLW